MLTLEDAIRHCKEVADGHTEQGKCPECAEEHRQLAEWLTDYKRLKERESWEDEYIKYIKVPKKALKYRTAGMVAYNAEWLKNHFDIERVVICGAQQPCCDCISRQEVIDLAGKSDWFESSDDYNDFVIAVCDLPSVNPQKTGHWKRISMDKYSEHAKYWYRCDRCGKDNLGNTDWCPNCGAKMLEKQGDKE